MHGRIYIGLLAAFCFSVSLTQGQSVGARRDASSAPVPASSAVATKSLDVFPPDPIQKPLPWRPPSFPAPNGFAHLVRAAGIIFSGTVTNIDRTSINIPGQSAGTIAITFHVESAIRGATAGESLTITQWIGLWSAGQRYRVGERVLLFLYPRSRIGLTSCVGATVGRFRVDSWGAVSLSSEQILAFRTDPVLGGKSRVRLSDFASMVRSAGEEE